MLQRPERQYTTKWSPTSTSTPVPPSSSSTRSLLGLWRVPNETRSSWSHLTTCSRLPQPGQPGGLCGVAPTQDTSLLSFGGSPQERLRQSRRHVSWRSHLTEARSPTSCQWPTGPLPNKGRLSATTSRRLPAGPCRCSKSRSRTMMFCVTRPPASRQMRLAALSTAYPLRPRTPARAQAARW